MNYEDNRKVKVILVITSARSISRAVSRKWWTHCARDRWVVGIQPFSSLAS